MRLDKFIAEQTGLTRTQATKALKSSLVTVNDKIIKSGATKITSQDVVIFDEQPLEWLEQGQYFMLYKPQGYVCSNDDSEYPTVFDFFDYPLKGKLHCAGRLDADTTGLVLLTDDGQWSHRITSPKHQCEKTYLVTLADPVEPFYEEKLQQGIMLRGEKTPTLPAKLEVLDDYNVTLTISEGRYHQVKRMFAALGNKVEFLHRCKIGGVALDNALEEGEFRALTEEEITFF
ncbi:16S rRNA pseudouridine(516) synthase RsuA [Pasteurella skyensis]|uniref:Pseudouridine synthase n=1 Tax=Phocoenobacter skyensis TaxID=97481 RepID=A0AAJ6NZZ3_9PAST|nr:16S rRNA pseudouridine(516) synthase RsuA [Pasteurella skyensis]MDP8161879.1 16S rRNA pseudouridine(516) synthase RsuA [Pasteurella skyensis]MDP8172035.1 16S rRNA pseudouridine(516) synthase RsuA [Pasteurella skyensis]MDP8176270.1 16S rRNA pseudouridine(516) synthase RsuA [Pasteurella skyensis]MDP8178290.1 16S rRNA pseudouridine(516) synthase RsuA [Pasteurella skyensis]MDP8182102.1 16S rRNA pseudouridine(516) synthase RsuA [Pasteurella skyensis]